MNAKKLSKRDAQSDQVPRAKDEAELPPNGFPVVGIGASAGGLEAFTQFLKALPEDSGMAFVFILHLAPEHKSMLPEVLGRATSMPVTQAVDGHRLEPNHVYIIPPNADLSVENRILHLTTREETRAPHLPVDHFLRSLAEDQDIRAVGVVLSGTGSDGALGLEFVKSQGGITFAQRPDSAKHDGMPRAAIETGCVDFVLSPAEIAGELLRIERHPYVKLAKSEKDEEAALDKDQLKAVFALLRAQSTVDFTCYKQATLRRRILRRMALHKIDTVDSYVEYLRNQPAEVQALYKDVLINVTSFFRDPEVFEALKQTLLPAIIRNHAADAPIRIWVPGCSTGEEAYSIAMCLVEMLPSPVSVLPQIFATDISDAALEKARAGIYRDNISLDVSPERLNRFFVKLASGKYQVCKAIREWCVFARQNVVRDPPFSKLDVISCRNVLIYLEPVLQQRVLRLFHYALVPGGFLVLGGSESIGSFTDLFAMEDKKHKFYARKLTPARATFEFSVAAHAPGNAVAAKRLGNDVQMGLDVQKAADLTLMARAPANVLIDEDFQIVQFRGRTGDYLEPAPGSASLNLLKMARAGLLLALRTAIHEAKQTGLSVRKDDVAVETGAQRKLVDIEVIPVKSATARWHFLVLFEEKKDIAVSSRDVPADAAKQPATVQLGAERQIEQLKHELAATKDFLLATSEEQQNVTESLKASNEEILSSNEELQSTNEELETAKEELQSSNEELKTVNDELQRSLEQTARAKEYVEVMVDHMSKALLVLDGKLRVRKVNQAFCRTFRTSRSESEDKLVYDLGSGQWNAAGLRELLEKILPAKAEIRDFEVTHDFPVIGRRTVLLDAHQIHWGADQEEMILLGIKDITERRQAEALLRRNESRLRLAVESTRLGMWDFDPVSGRIEWSDFCRTILGQPTEATYVAFLARVHPEDRDRVHQLFQSSLDPQKSGVHASEFRMLWPDGSVHWVVAHGQALFESSGNQRRVVSMVGTISDITDQRLRDEHERLLSVERAANRAKDEFLAVLSHELRTPLMAMLGWVRMLQTHEFDKTTAKKGLAVIERNVKTQTHIIEDLLDVSRIIVGKMSIERRRLDLAAIVADAIAEFAPAAEAKQLTLQYDPATALLVDGDQVRLRQVIWNLLSNAIKFTPPGGRIEVVLRDEDGQAVLSVSDTGKGISKEFLAHMFHRFEQEDASSSRRYMGLGLGLAIVRSIVELHGGSITAESEGEGKGARVSVKLPILDRQQDPLVISHEGEAARSGQRLDGTKVLVVDDDEDARELLATVLRMAGAEVHVVASASEALVAFQQFQPAILVSDIGMPDEDGCVLIQKLRALEQREGRKLMPAIALTGYAQLEDAERAKAAGYQTHLAKPVEPDLLIQMIARMRTQNV